MEIYDFVADETIDSRYCSTSRGDQGRRIYKP